LTAPGDESRVATRSRATGERGEKPPRMRCAPRSGCAPRRRRRPRRAAGGAAIRRPSKPAGPEGGATRATRATSAAITYSD